MLYIRCKLLTLSPSPSPYNYSYLYQTLIMKIRFGIEFAPEVVQADGNVRNLAWRVCNAKKVLVSLT